MNESTLLPAIIYIIGLAYRFYLQHLRHYHTLSNLVLLGHWVVALSQSKCLINFCLLSESSFPVRDSHYNAGNLWASSSLQLPDRICQHSLLWFTEIIFWHMAVWLITPPSVANSHLAECFCQNIQSCHILVIYNASYSLAWVPVGTSLSTNARHSFKYYPWLIAYPLHN